MKNIMLSDLPPLKEENMNRPGLIFNLVNTGSSSDGIYGLFLGQTVPQTLRVNNKDYSFVFIGPVTTDISRLKGKKNIHFLGSRPYEFIPNYLKAFSVGTIPFVLDGVTLKVSPIKFYEYLASGIPIVSTALPDLKDFGQFVSLVDNKEDFSLALEKTIKNENKKLKLARMKHAEKFSWEKRFNQLNKSIESI